VGINFGVGSIPIIGVFVPDLDMAQGIFYGDGDHNIDPINAGLKTLENANSGKLNSKGKIICTTAMKRWNRFLGPLGKLYEIGNTARQIKECAEKASRK